MMKTEWRSFLRRRGVCAALTLGLLAAVGCSKRIKFTPSPLARSATATVRVQLTYDRNNILQVQMENVVPPSQIKEGYTRYVLWVRTPDRQHTFNVGQIRVEDSNKVEIQTLTPFRNFTLLITAEPSGEVLAPGPDVVFESEAIQW